MAHECKDILVSIVIPAHNAAAFVERAIASAQEQSHRNVEIIVVNDGSSDRTGEIVSGLALKDPRITLIEHFPKRGVSAARNLAIHQAKGDWIAPLDADDRFSPDRILKMLNFAQMRELDLVSDNLLLRDFETGEILGAGFPDAWMETEAEITLRYLLEHDVPGIFKRELGFMKPLIRRSFLTKHLISYSEDIRAGEDLLLYATCLQAGANWRFIKDALYVYSVRQGSVSSTPDANLDSMKVNRRLMTMLQNRPDLRALLELREIMINYELFIWHFRSRRAASAIAVARKIPASFLNKRLGAALLRRLGFHPKNPSEALLNAVIAV